MYCYLVWCISCFYMHMLYYRYAYSEVGQPTIVPKDNTVRLGMASAPSPIDKMKINSLYQCGRYQTQVN